MDTRGDDWTELATDVEREKARLSWPFVHSAITPIYLLTLVRCDGDSNPAVRCTGCAVNDFPCTYDEPSQRRTQPKGYVQILEDRVKALEAFLQHLLPGKNLDEEVKAFTRSRRPAKPSTSADDSPFSIPIPKAPSSLGSSSNPASKLDEDYVTTLDKMLRLQIQMREADILAARIRYNGTSSTTMLVRKALEIRRRSKTFIPKPPHGSVISIRPELWTKEAWEWKAGEIPFPTSFAFPPPELMSLWVDKYFEEVNMYLPVLHRPTFIRLLFHEHLHLRDQAFASTVLAVCAIGEKQTSDGLADVQTEKLKGWSWFNQIQGHRLGYHTLPGLFDLQRHALSAIFLRLASHSHACWNMLGGGIRLAADVGAHRKWKNINVKHDAEYELYKRVMWVLVCMDRWMSAMLGRPAALHDDDLDIDLPVHCDDEWWNHLDPEKAWIQPAELPSEMSFFISFLGLTRLLTRCVHTMYTLKDRSAEKHDELVSEMDSSLNNWFDSIPSHLRWSSDLDPSSNQVFLGQCAFLHSHYHYVQILVHRSFIPAPGSTVHGSPIPSLTICTSAARQIVRILSVFLQHTASLTGLRGPALGWLPLLTDETLLVAGIVLMFGVWIENNRRNLEDVKVCLDTLRAMEGRDRLVGQAWDVLSDFASEGTISSTAPNESDSHDTTEHAHQGIPMQAPNIMDMPNQVFSLPEQSAASITEADLHMDLFDASSLWDWEGLADWTNAQDSEYSQYLYGYPSSGF